MLEGLGFRRNRPRHSAEPGYDPPAKAQVGAITELLSPPVAGSPVLAGTKGTRIRSRPQDPCGCSGGLCTQWTRTEGRLRPAFKGYV